MNLRVAVFHDYPNGFFITLSSVLAFLALRPTPSSVPIVLNLTTLLVYSRILFPNGNALRNTALLTIAVAIAGALSRLTPALDALSTAGVSILCLCLLSSITSILTISVVYLDTRLCTRFSSAWSQLTLFPALWATLWLTVSLVSPLGRLSAWSPAESGGLYGWMAPYLGPVGKDWVVAAWAVVCSQTIGAWYIGETEEPDEPLIIHVAPATKQPSHLSHSSSILLLAALLAFLAVPPLVLSNFPLAVLPPATTPLSVGCVLPPYQRYKRHTLTLDDYVAESQRLTSSAKVLLWPEGAVTFTTEAEKAEAFAKVHKLVTGSVVGVSFEETFRHSSRNTTARRTGIAIISQASDEPELIYYKRHLVPIAESFSLSHSEVPPGIVTLELTHPKEVPKTQWGEAPNYTRPIPITASICLDFASPSPFAELYSKPALILAPARTWDIAVGYAMWRQASQRAEELGSMVLWCDGGDGGVSGVAGGGFRDFTQVGLGSWVKVLGIQYPFNSRRTPYAYAGNLVVLLAWFLVLGSTAIRRTHFGGYTFERVRNILRARMPNAALDPPREQNLLE